MTTVTDITDILRIIREQPEWADALRGALLGKELLELPQRFAEFAEIANKRFAALESDVAELKSGQARLEAGQARLEGDVTELKAGQARLEGDVGNLRGANYEQKVATNIATYIRDPLSIRRVRVLKARGMFDAGTFYEIVDSSEDQGIISKQERTEVGRTDIVLRGQRDSDQSTVYVAVEVSVTAADSDINRAAGRSEILRRATGETAIAAVACANWDGSRQHLAQERNVALITVGE